MKFTVILLRPDYLTDNFGQDAAVVHAEGETMEEAILNGRESLAEEDRLFDCGDHAKVEDYFVMATFPGHHDNVASGSSY